MTSQGPAPDMGPIPPILCSLSGILPIYTFLTIFKISPIDLFSMERFYSINHGHYTAYIFHSRDKVSSKLTQALLSLPS